MFGERIPVVDSWGNTIGEFIPAGEGCGLFFLLLLPILACAVPWASPIWLPILAIYFEKKGRHDFAVVCWAFTLMLYILLFIAAVGGAVFGD